MKTKEQMQAQSPDRPGSEPSDQKLVAAFKAGAVEALERIVDRYGDPIFNFGLKMCGQSQDAEDIAQETFLSAFRYLNGFRGETKLKNWLFKIAARACLRKRRKKKGQPEQELSLEALAPPEGGARFDIPDWSEDPADHLLRSEMRRILAEAVQALPPKYRIVFNLRDIEGFSTEETAEILEITPQAVKTRLHRARLFLRQRISTLYGEKGEHES